MLQPEVQRPQEAALAGTEAGKLQAEVDVPLPCPIAGPPELVGFCPSCPLQQPRLGTDSSAKAGEKHHFLALNPGRLPDGKQEERWTGLLFRAG